MAALMLAATAAFSQTPSNDLKKLLDEEWAWRLHENPLLATSVGDHSTDDKLPSVTVADYERREKDMREFLKRLQGIDRAKLTDADRINYDIFGRSLRDRITESEFKGYLMPITNREGFHTN